MGYMEEYDRWVRFVKEEDLADALKAMDEAQIEDAFYRNLAFGTGGLRGTIGVGTNRMNVHTVAKASQGLADYLVSHAAEPSVMIPELSQMFLRVRQHVFLLRTVWLSICGPH